MVLKRKANAFKEAYDSEAMDELRTSDMSEGPSKKRSRQVTTKAKKAKPSTTAEESSWPDYFHSLFKIFKATNTVLAFVSSKRQLATSFSAVRSSVEGLLKHPLEIAKVSEIKALLPDLVKFSYIPLSELTINEDTKNSARSVDYSKAIKPGPPNSQGHVLVLDFAETLGGKKTSSASGSSPSSATVKKLIEARNARFQQAINELISAASGDDPVSLLRTAGHTYLPVNHTIPVSSEDEKSIPQKNERPSIGQVISDIKASIWYKDQVVYHRTTSAKEAQTADLNPPISQQISDAVLNSRNISALYSHQAAAIEAIRSGKDVVVSTSTASGKSVIYQIPLLSFLEEDLNAKAIFIFPTKALAQDQKASLEQLVEMCPSLSHLKVATYDGDTPQEARAEIRDSASVILTNFDTLHASILPNEEKWRSFLKKLKILVVDELHYYTGFFGSHVAHILRRLRRVCAAVGNRRIRFVSCSATLANPAEYMSRMFALNMAGLEVLENDGAPSGGKDYLIWNPPLIDDMDPSLGRRSSLNEASHLMRLLMKKGVRVILFCKIRKVCELAMKTIKADLSNEGRLDILERVKAYRGGYTREDRRNIEHEAFSGQLLGIVATNALELGIDIGALDAVIMLGFPTTVSNFKQQAGRAGRRSRDSLAIMVADPFPIDQHFVNNPSELFENSLDDLIVDIDNEVILEAHLQCAAYELPLTKEDEKWFGPLMVDICEKGLKKDTDGWYHTHTKFLPFPSRHVSIRGAQEETYAVVEMRDEQAQQASYMLEEIEFSRALFELYEGGVFMHQGETFIIKELSHDAKVAKVVRTDVNYITSPRDYTRIYPLQTYRTVALNGNLVQLGRMNICTKVFGFFKIRGKVILDAVELLSPPWERETTGFWIDLPTDILECLNLEEIDGAAAIHATEHAFLNQFVLSQDVKTDCRIAKEEYTDADTPAKRPPRLIFYDAAGKTGGVVARAFDHVHTLMNRARITVNDCKCPDGCALCVQSTFCKDANLVSSKAGAAIILNGLFGIKPELEPIDPSNILEVPSDTNME